MLSQSKVNPTRKTSRISKFDREKLDTPITVRVVFQKTGNLQYFSHLDLQRTWQRVLVRASIPMWYTQGFNPHPKIVFGVPLPVGSEGLEEMVDLRIDRQITPAEIKAQLNAELTDEMQVSEVYIPTTAFSDIAWGTYQMTVKTPGDPAANAAAINKIFAPDAEPIIMTKRSKSGDKEIDIIPMIRRIKVVHNADRAGEIRISAILSAGNTEHLNPEMLIKAAKERLGILSGNPTEESYTILRTHVYQKDGVTEFK